MSSPIQHILVIGAGAQGAPVIAGLQQRGLPLRVLRRKSDALPAGIGVAGDLDDLDSLHAAFAGISHLFFHLPIPAAPDAPARQLGHVLAAAQKAGVRRIVFSSSGPSDAVFSTSPLAAGNQAAVQAVLASGIPATVLKPMVYLDNLNWPHLVDSVRHRGVLDYPPLAATRRLSWTSQRDQADAAIAALLQEGDDSQTLDMVSADALTGEELAALLGEAAGRTVRYAPPTAQAFGEVLGAQLGSAEAGAVIGGLYATLDAQSRDGAVFSAAPLTAALGVKPRSIAQWVREEWGTAMQLN